MDSDLYKGLESMDVPPPDSRPYLDSNEPPEDYDG